MDTEVLSRILEAKQKRQALAVVTRLEGGDQTTVAPFDVKNHPLAEHLVPRFKSGKSGVVDMDGAEYFIQLHIPSPRLVIIGAVHITQALAPMAAACNFDVMIVDPRTAFATPERFEGFNLHAEWPQDMLDTLALDPYTALVAVTHDPKIDDTPLQAALEAECFYVGALGSRKTHAKRVDRLKAAGLNDGQIHRIAAPIGLNIGAANPPEIAVAIMAQMIAALRAA
ncbi:MAG: XdhC family protein [Pseudomonadota bacterium]